MPRRTYKTPGVYVKEISLAAPSIEALPTAVPTFIGYTPRCEIRGKSCRYAPIKIQSLDAFVRIFGKAHSADGSGKPSFHLEPANVPSPLDSVDIHGTTYSIIPDASTVYYLYDSLRLFFENGGGEAYVVSTGPIEKPSSAPATNPGSLVNPNVRLADLLAGLAALKGEAELTLYACPDASLLTPADNATLMQRMLQQNAKTRSAVSLLDVPEGRAPEPTAYLNGIAAFRSRLGNQHLSFGIAYYPFLNANIVQPEEIDHRNLFQGDLSQLEPLLDPPGHPNRAAAKLLGLLENASPKKSLLSEYEEKLEVASDTYRRIKDSVRQAANRLPPTGAIAGVIAKTDQSRGVWKAPANVALHCVSNLSIQLTSSQQAPLNIDPNEGKSINAIRKITGRGILIWGARTLAGNDPALRFIPARRMLLFLERSILRGLKPFVFEPNDANTWSSIRQVIEDFLRQLWRSGAFAGYSERDAFNVQCGLGSTMTPSDLSAHRIKIQVAVALQRPAEFSVLPLSLSLLASP